MFDNVASEVAKFFGRIIGWLSMDLAVYQGHSIASRSRFYRSSFSAEKVSDIFLSRGQRCDL
jgi:hypothetical protein